MHDIAYQHTYWVFETPKRVVVYTDGHQAHQTLNKKDHKIPWETLQGIRENYGAEALNNSRSIEFYCHKLTMRQKKEARL